MIGAMDSHQQTTLKRDCRVVFCSSSLSRRRLSAAFTLIELLVAIGILGVVAGVIAACLAGGIRVWDVARKFNMGEADACIGLIRFEKDLMNSFRFQGIDFKGMPREISFPGLIEYPRAGDGSGETVEEIVTVKYYVDETGRVLLRKAIFFRGGMEQQAEAIATGLQQATMKYYARGAEETGGGWMDEWPSNATNFPSAVRIELSFMKDGERPISRTVVLPVAAPPGMREASP